MLFLEIILQPCISLIGWREYYVSVFDSIDLLCKKILSLLGKSFYEGLDSQTPEASLDIHIMVWVCYYGMKTSADESKVMVKTNCNNKERLEEYRSKRWTAWSIWEPPFPKTTTAFRHGHQDRNNDGGNAYGIQDLVQQPHQVWNKV